MDIIECATRAIKELLSSVDMLSDDVITVVDNALSEIWHIESPILRIQIIQNAAIELGILRAEDID